jgi:hypothetical protein
MATIKQKIQDKIWELEEAESNPSEEIYVMDWLKLRVLNETDTEDNLEKQAKRLNQLQFRNEKQNCLLDAINEILTT